MGIAYNYNLNKLRPAPTQAHTERVAKRLGGGFALPLQFLYPNVVLMRSGAAKVKQDIWVVLSTPVGVRQDQPDYGSLLPRSLFQRITPVVLLELKKATGDAIAAWVPQVTVVKIVANISTILDEAVEINIGYQIQGSSAIDSMQIIQTIKGTQLGPDQFTVQSIPVFNQQGQIIQL